MVSEQNSVKIEARAYPIAEPKNNTIAFAGVTINDMFAVNGIRVVKGEKGNFVAMPQMKDSKGEYRDICFPVTGELRKHLNSAVLEAYKEAIEKNVPEKNVPEKNVPEKNTPEKNTPEKNASEKTSVKEQIDKSAKTTKEKPSKSKSTKEKSEPTR